MIHRITLEDIRKISKDIKHQANDLAGKTVLITGGSGFLGKYFLYTLWYLNKSLRKKCKVISVDNFITGTKHDGNFLSGDSHFTFIQHDVRKKFLYDGPISHIIHAAGIASPVYYMKYPLETLEVATLGTRNMLELAREKKAKSFLFFSSSEVYGDPDPNFVPTPETYPGNVSSIGPRSCYDESKRLGETMCLVYFKLFGIPVKIVRPFNVYGPGMRLDDYRVIPSYLTSALKNLPLPVHVGGNQTRTFCYISDATSAFLKVLLSKKNGEVYNVGNDTPEVNMMNLARMVSDLFSPKIAIQSVKYPIDYPQEGPKRRCPDLTKIRKNLGYSPKVDLKAGLSRTLHWYKDQL